MAFFVKARHRVTWGCLSGTACDGGSPTFPHLSAVAWTVLSYHFTSLPNWQRGSDVYRRTHDGHRERMWGRSDPWQRRKTIPFAPSKRFCRRRRSASHASLHARVWRRGMSSLPCGHCFARRMCNWPECVSRARQGAHSVRDALERASLEVSHSALSLRESVTSSPALSSRQAASDETASFFTGGPRCLLDRPPRRRPSPEAIRGEHRRTGERRPPGRDVYVRQAQHVALAVHPGDDVAEALPVVEPLLDHRLLGRLRLALSVEERDGESGGEERAAAGEVESHGIRFTL